MKATDKAVEENLQKMYDIVCNSVAADAVAAVAVDAAAAC